MKQILSIMLLMNFITAFAQDKVDPEKELIIAAINDYIEGRNNGDIERLRRAFLPTATLKGVNDKTKEMTVMPVADYIAKNTPGKKHNCTTEISFVSYANEVAIGHVIITYETHVYFDYLVLMKVNDKWIIADKIYTRKNL